MSGDMPGPTPLQPGKDAVLEASIVITTYRRTAMLGELLGALVPQLKNHAVEVVVVDNCPDCSAKTTVERLEQHKLRYVHEARSGVVFARNRGVAEARGSYVIFLDDDEVPSEQWLEAWLGQADGETNASFARIVPRLLVPCAPELLTQVQRNFSRDLRRPTGADASDMWAYLGTGNAMFHKDRCLNRPGPFDERFNERGGEDVWLIRSLVREGRRLLWNHDALVDELVPEDRMTLASLRLRRFNQGQLRCILMFGNGGAAGLMRVAIWMIVGAIQFVIFGTAARLASFAAPAYRADFLCRTSGGLGKMLWWREARMGAYGSAKH